MSSVTTNQVGTTTFMPLDAAKSSLSLLLASRLNTWWNARTTGSSMEMLVYTGSTNLLSGVPGSRSLSFRFSI